MIIEVNNNTHPCRGELLFKAIVDELIHKGFSLSENGRILFHNGISDDAKISRYMNLRQLLHFLNGEMSFSKRSSFSDLTERGFYNDPRLVSINQDTGIGGCKRNGYIKNKIEMFKCTGEFYASCWTTNETESYLMWKAYSPTDSGVRVTSTINSLLSHLDIVNNSFVICGPMTYNQSEIDKNNYKSVLFSKNLGYQDEAEYRFYYIDDNHNTASRKYVNIRPDCLDGIAFTPLFGKDNMIEQANLIMKLFGFEIQNLFMTPTIIDS